MTMGEAEQLGYSYTGISWNVWRDSEEYIKQQKERAKKIKKTFKGADYVIVTGRKSDWLGSSDSKAIMGNDIFWKYQSFNLEATKKEIDSFDERKAELYKKYEEELKALENKHNKLMEEYEEALSLMK